MTALLNTAKQQKRCAYGTNRAERMALRRRLQADELICPYKGIYVEKTYWSNLSREEQSQHTIRTLARRHPNWVFTGISAACIYNVEHSYALHDGTVYIASSGGINGQDEPHLQRIYMQRIPVRKYRGMNVTSPERMLIDCTSLPFAQSLAIYDSALRNNLITTNAVQSLALQCVCDEAAVSKLLKYANPLSENGGESFARGTILERHFAIPLLQVEFNNPNHPESPYRVDFLWKLADGRIIVAEYDGTAKYADASNANRASIRAKLEYERNRERHLKDQKVTVIVHLFYEDVVQPWRLEKKLREAGVPQALNFAMAPTLTQTISTVA
ncbi:hypothetical protein F7D08_1184 [Bifidobacterium cebidarum]|uniref:CTP synthase n=1 Tax=Bifidobacterium cebidarum TaxID=2650773 RepID=A0A6I1GF37_9BIFI|nr:hypothetical protein F7D08_1184 [Bifidobacterium cebidarum]